MKTYYKLILIVLLLLGSVFPTQAQENEGQAYIIQANDSLWKLAEKYLGDGQAYLRIVEATADKANEDDSFQAITNPNVVLAGQRIWIPGNAEPQTESRPTTTQSRVTETRSIASEVQTPPAQSVINGPTGHIAFSFWNNHPHRCTYETNIISVPDCLASPTQCQATRRIIPLNNISEPALSPDGTRLAFRSWGEPLDETSPYLHCASPHPYRFLGNTTLAGTEFTGTGGFWEDSHPDWSPDGQRLLFDSSRLGDGVTRIYLINADGSDEQDLFIIGQQPSWAADGQRFVYRGCDLQGNRCGFWLAQAFEPKSWDRGINMIGSVILGDQIAHPDWSPTREEIVYQRNENGNWNLWLANMDGSNDRRLTNGPNLEGLPAWSPDGNWIAYVAHNGQNWSLYLISRDGAENQHLFTYDGGFYAIPNAAEPYGVRDWLDEQISWSR